jgi:hypothetical protein
MGEQSGLIDHELYKMGVVREMVYDSGVCFGTECAYRKILRSKDLVLCPNVRST